MLPNGTTAIVGCFGDVDSKGGGTMTTTLIDCGACGKPVSPAATTCPACGHPVKATIAAATPPLSAASRKTLRRIVALVALVVVALGVGAYIHRKRSIARSARYELVSKLNQGSTYAESKRFFSIVDDDDAIEIGGDICDERVLREYRETHWIMAALEEGDVSWFGCVGGVPKLEPPWRY